MNIDTETHTFAHTKISQYIFKGPAKINKKVLTKHYEKKNL